MKMNVKSEENCVNSSDLFCLGSVGVGVGVDRGWPRQS